MPSKIRLRDPLPGTKAFGERSRLRLNRLRDSGGIPGKPETTTEDRRSQEFGLEEETGYRRKGY